MEPIQHSAIPGWICTRIVRKDYNLSWEVSFHHKDAPNKKMAHVFDDRLLKYTTTWREATELTPDNFRSFGFY